ncbi:GGDEF domain-containing protein [Dyella acidiphila]|uniref:diguanylate cyclase n=1 Tax=Dyella acidiphila TaxID=2775866 RepID=A0ABR9G735_9GAMM|nr:GGDEF domain-containing protein [Dyella acidiphila]MBE1159850.1 GGDEF domain-containing protein [Dyella acidiphila]
MAAGTLLLSMVAGIAPAATNQTDDTAQLFARADTPLKMLDNTAYVGLIAQLERKSASLSETDKWHLRYLEAWQTAFVGQNDKARVLLEAIAKQAPTDDLRERARGTLINILGLGHRYEEAFAYLDQALDELPNITRNSTRQLVLGEAAQLLTEAGQYDLAINYADQLLQIPDASGYSCTGMRIRVGAEFHKGPHTDKLLSLLEHAVTTCLANSNTLSADTLRRDIAALKIEQDKSDEAIALLQNSYSGMMKLQYQDLASQYDVLLAEAYWKQGNLAQAEKYAVATVDIASKSEFAEPLSSAYQLLYQIARQKGDLRDALMYHEKFMSADNAHLDDVREKALAYQVVKQQVDAKKTELDTLNKQNQILQLQQALDRNAVQTSRLYIVLLLTLLASIGLWLYRLKRSQLRFMRMAREDGLTGIFNRQHFVDEAEQAMRSAAKATRCASLLLIDLDHFKAINDTHGHIVGDQVLRRTVAVCQRYLRSGDVFGRLGGEEFGILLPDCSAETAIERAEQIRRAIYSASADESQDIPISASLGIASSAHHGHDLRDLLAAADEALYRAKRDGRNRVVINISGYGATSAPTPKGGERNMAGRISDIAKDGEPFNYATEK